MSSFTVKNLEEIDDSAGERSPGLARRQLLPLRPTRGGRVVRAAVARKEAAEDAGRRAARPIVAVARLAPAGLVPIRE